MNDELKNIKAEEWTYDHETGEIRAGDSVIARMPLFASRDNRMTGSVIAHLPEILGLLEGIADVIRRADASVYYSLPSHISGIAPKIEELFKDVEDYQS